MVTKEQAQQLSYGAEVHYTGRHDCTRIVGPRGGITESITRCRVTGACETWRREPARFRLPVKHGMRAYGAIDSHSWEGDPRFWHLASECPLLACRECEQTPCRCVVSPVSRDRMSEIARTGY